jgi:hypothetical protein
MMFFTAAVTVLVVPLFPETYAPVILFKKVASLYSLLSSYVLTFVLVI